MLFHSLDFLAFFVVVYPVHLLLRRTRFMNAWLLLASYVFYGWWNPSYLPLIFATTVIDFGVARRIERSNRKKLWLIASLFSNLGVLAFFKYISFFTRNLNGLFNLLGLQTTLPVLDPILPLGISFFTFQSISYVVDVYRGLIPAETSFIRYAAYVSLFPQMISGPICRAGSLLPQLRSAPRISSRDFTQGASLFLVGLFKKVALADYLAMYVDRVYLAPENFRAPALVLATFAFAWQIYFDFSGYTDMARGVARTMGFHLTPNFDAPYVAEGLGDFWRRWNITVSSWFRDYVYISLGGNRGSALRTSRNIAVTMLLSGLWHGASWSFVLWGALHGLARVATRELRPIAGLARSMPRWMRQSSVFLFVSFAWIFFRARGLADAGLIVVRLFTSGWADPRFPFLMLIPIAAVWSYQHLENTGARALEATRLSPVRIGLAAFMIGYLVFVSQPAAQTFIYFQF
jgi:D-alanyl-lipoteichoic acid acyltransferase DltB (MBOAT superfamily)